MTIEDSSGATSAAVARPATSCSARKAEEDAVAVRVAVHIRPLIEAELAKGCQEILDVAPDQPQITVGQHTFSYDNVYGSGGGADAICLYPDCVQPLVDGLFKGYNATVFAYGQTGSGKTYTMGSSWSPDDMECQGVIPRVMDELFTRVEAEPHTEFTVKVSFVEIHKEEVRDLLWTNGVAPRPVVTIRELPSGVSLAGATEKQVRSREEMSTLLMQGTLMRAVASTNMNNRSSRSHAIFTITLEQRRRQLLRPASAPPAVEYTPGGTAMPQSDSSEGDTTEDEDEGMEGTGDEYLIAKMHLVDLAGSERAKRTGAEGMRLKEAININKGLLALAKVITALVENQSHVPYRDSKLTRLLQDSLGGNSRTCMIACVSPADINREESLNTLRYADRARRIKNKPVVNRDPVAAQLAALRQQVAALKAENNALKTALGGDAAAAAVFAAAGRAGQQVASEALQEAYDDLAVRCNDMEVQNAKQQMELDTAHGEVKLLRDGLLQAETQRDQVMLRLEALQRALAACSDETVKAALQQDAAAVAAEGSATPAMLAASGLPLGEDQSERQGAGSATGIFTAAAESTQQQLPATGIVAELSVVTNLRARVAELETELRQVRSLQRMTSSVLVRGMSNGGMGRSSACGNARSRAPSHTGTSKAGRGGAHNSRHGSPPVAVSLDGVSLEEEDIDACSPMTPARQTADDLDEPLMEVEPDAEVLAQSAAHMVAREAMTLKLAVLGRQMEAKQKRLLALQSAANMEGAKSKYMMELQKERDTLAKEKTALLQKLQAVEVAGAEERKRLEQQYRDKLTAVERRLKELAEREKAAKRSAAQLGRVQSVCQQLQSDIARMKTARAAVQRRMEAKEKEFREWRLLREREVLQLRRNAQRQSAALQQHQAMHSKQQAVLKRKTEEAEAARRKLRDLLELQARVQRDKRGGRGQGADERGGAPADLELQPNAGAPLLRTEKARREWVEQELELCSTSWQYQKVLDGELAQRAEATRKLREVQKQLMLLGGLVPPSPVVTAAAAAAAAASRGGGVTAAIAKSALPKEEVLQQEAAKLQAAIEKHSASVKELQEQWERARCDEQSRGAGAADVKRWTGIRNIIEARELLRTLFLSACGQKALVCESQMELAKLQETAEILQIKLDMAMQQAAEAKRKALEAEATTAAVITTPAHHLALAAAAANSDSEEDCNDPEGLGRRQHMRLTKQGSADRTATAATAASRHDVHAAGVVDILGQLGANSIASSAVCATHDDVRDDVDIEADNLLHSMGLPPIMEMPTPEDSAFAPPSTTAAGRSRSLSGQVGSHSMGKRYTSPFSSQSSSSRYQQLLQLQMGGKAWRSSLCSPRSASCPLDGGAGSNIADASECTVACSNTVFGTPTSNTGEADAASAPQPRLSLSVGGDNSAASSSSPSAAGVRVSQSLGGGSAAAAGASGGLRRSERAGSLGMKTAAQELAAKLDALEVDWKGYKKQSGAEGGHNRRSVPGRASYGSVPGSFGLSANRPASAIKGQLGIAVPAPVVNSNEGNGPGRQQRSMSACNSPAGNQHPAVAGFWPHQQGLDTDGCDHDADGATENLAAVAKELNFLEIEPEPATSPPLGSSNSSPEPQLAGRRGSISNRQGSESHPGSGSRPASQATPPKFGSRAYTNNTTQRRGPHCHRQHDDGFGGSSRRRSGHWARTTDDGLTQQQLQQQRRNRGDEAEQLVEDDENIESADEHDNEDSDPSYDPAVGTPIGRGASRRNSRNSRHARHTRLSAGSSETSENTGIPVSASARVSGRWGGSYPSSRATSTNSSTNSAHPNLAAFLSGNRSLAAQVSFNHEKRRGWERPVLEDINTHRANVGLPPVEKLTIQLLKEAMTGQEIDGKIWTAGAKTKDNLIADYRRMLNLNERVDEETDIDRITGAATWSMPSSPISSPEDQADTAAAGHSAGGQRSKMAEGGISSAMRRSRSMGTQVAATARRVLSAGSQSGSETAAVSPLGHNAQIGSSPVRIMGRTSSGRVRSGSPGSSGAVNSQQAARYPVSHSVDGSLLAASGAERILRESPVGALQQAAQRSVQRSSSQKFKISVPSTRIDGPYSARLPPANSSAGGGHAETSDSRMPQQQQILSAERSTSASRQGQPTWR